MDSNKPKKLLGVVNTQTPKIPAWREISTELHTVFVTSKSIDLIQHNVELILTMVVVTLQYY